MNLSKPSDKVLHEYLLVYGEDWVKETYNMCGDQIDFILYGNMAVPTEKQQQEKKQKARNEDEAKGAYLENFKNDHFLWDKPNKKHLRCQEAKEKPRPELSDDFMSKWIDMYKKLMSWDMKQNNNGMRSHGWSLGERVINKTTSITTDDEIHNRMLRYLNSGEMMCYDNTIGLIKVEHKAKTEGHGVENEDFLEAIEAVSLDYKNKAIKMLDSGCESDD